jgi:hypothetical protein
MHRIKFIRVCNSTLFNNKSVGMVHIPGVNDKAYKAFKDAQETNVITFNPNLNQW